MTRILLVDDHRMIRQGIRALLNDQNGLEVVGEAENGREAVQMIKELTPNVVVMDLHMPELNGVDATRQAVALRPGIKVICLSANSDERMTAEMLQAGAAGYVLKESAFEELAVAIKTVMANKVYLSPSVARVMVGELIRNRSVQPSVFSVVSSREREVLQLIAEGKSTKQVAYQLHVSVKTAESHRRNLMEKLKIDNIADLTKYALREGLIAL